MSRRKQRDDDKAEVMMSPLIDAVFLLLVFFLVAMMYRKEIKDIDIVPPESISDQRMLPEDDTLVIGIDTEGHFFFQGRPMTATQLHAELRDVSLQTPERRIRLDADAESPFWRVAEILDALQFRGLSNVGIRTYDERYNR